MAEHQPAEAIVAAYRSIAVGDFESLLAMINPVSLPHALLMRIRAAEAFAERQGAVGSDPYRRAIIKDIGIEPETSDPSTNVIAVLRHQFSRLPKDRVDVVVEVVSTEFVETTIATVRFRTLLPGHNLRFVHTSAARLDRINGVWLIWAAPFDGWVVPGMDNIVFIESRAELGG